MALSNIEKFDETAGKVLAQLYEAFPMPKPLLVKTFVSQLFKSDCDFEQDLTDEAEFVLATLIWLHGAGFIKGDVCPPDGLSDAVLTLQGLEALKSVPDSLQAPLGERLMEAAKSDTRDVLRSLVGQVLGVGVQLITS